MIDHWKRLSSKQLVVAIQVLSLFCIFFEGYDQGLMGGVNSDVNYQEVVGIGSNGVVYNQIKQGGIVSIYYAGAVVGCFAGGWLADRFGRVNGVFYSAILSVIGGALQAGSVDAAMVLVARIISGLGAGSLTAIIPVWSSEIADAGHRGSQLGIIFLANYIGIASAYWISFGLSFTDSKLPSLRWRFLMAFQIIPALFVVCLIRLLPDSPRWLCSVGRFDEAWEILVHVRRGPNQQKSLGFVIPPQNEKVLVDDESGDQEKVAKYVRNEFSIDKLGDTTTLTGDNEVNDKQSSNRDKQRQVIDTKIHQEFNEMVNASKHIQKSNPAQNAVILAGLDKTGRRLGRRAWLSFFLQIMAEWTGITALTAYVPILLAQAGFDTITINGLSGGTNTIGIVGTLISAVIVDRLGRRNCLMGGALCLAIVNFIAAGLFEASRNDPNISNSIAPGAVAMLFLFNLCYASTWGTAAFLYPTEIFPADMRAQGNGFGIAGWAIGCGWTTLLNPTIFASLANRTYFLYGALNFAWILVIFFLYPETANRSLESIDALFSSRSPFFWSAEQAYRQRQDEIDLSSNDVASNKTQLETV